MPDDERESDDLFEDLDKFFAPIKDVDWDEPEAPSATASPDPAVSEEEHVTVRSEPEQVVSVPVAGDETQAAVFEDDDDDDGDWYDTASLEPVGQALGGSVGSDDADEMSLGGPAVMQGADEDQADLFAPPAAADDDWPGDDVEDQQATRPSDAELEEAAAHFAESDRRRERRGRTPSRPDRRGECDRSHGGARSRALPAR